MVYRLQLPKEMYKKLESQILKFFWNNKPEPVNSETMYLDLQSGGFRIVNILRKVNAFNVKHVICLKRMLSGNILLYTVLGIV